MSAQHKSLYAIFGISARHPVHNHALVSTTDFSSCTWFLRGRCYVGTFSTLGSQLSISLWRTKTSASFYSLYPSGVEQCLSLQRYPRALFIILSVNIISITRGGSFDFLSSHIQVSSEQFSFFSYFFSNERFWLSSHV